MYTAAAHGTSPIFPAGVVVFVVILAVVAVVYFLVTSGSSRDVREQIRQHVNRDIRNEQELRAHRARNRRVRARRQSRRAGE